MQLTFASYNIHKAVGLDRRRDPERIMAVLHEIDDDVVALQEADRRFGNRMSAIPHHLLLEQGAYRPVEIGGRPQSIGWHGNALLVRRGIEVRHSEIVPLPTLEPRGAVLADLVINGHPLRVIGTHLDLSGLWRRRQIRALLARLDGAAHHLPTVLMGDFNQWSDRGALSEFAFHHHRLVKTPPSFHSNRPVARLDRIIVSHDIMVESSGAHQSDLSKRASDHLPLWATLKYA